MAEAIDLLLEETAEAIETESEAMASGMTVQISEGLASLDWEGSMLTLGEEELGEVVSSVGDKVLPDVVADSDFANAKEEMAPLTLRYLEGLASDGATAGEELGETSGKLARMQFETEGAQLASKAAEEAGESNWKSLLSKAGSWTKAGLQILGKIAFYGIGIGMALDWVGSKLGDLISVDLRADDAPEWAQNMTDDQKADLQAVSDAIPKLSVLIQGWQQQWETYQSSYVDLGTVTVTFSSTTQEIPVMYILFYAFQDMSNIMTNTQTIFSGDTSTLSTADMIMATNNMFTFLADALSMYDLKAASDHLSTLDLPPDSDKETLTAIILTFKDGPDKVADIGVNYTRFATENAITSYLQVKIIQEVYRQLQDVVLPQMQEAAKSAFQSTAKSYMNGVSGDIKALALIPGAGVGLAESKLADEQKTASEKGTEAAQKAAEEVLAKLQPEVNQQAIDTIQQYADENQDQLKKIAELAMQDALGDVTAKLQVDA